MKRSEFILWILATFAVAVLAAYFLVGCSATDVAESLEVGVSHGEGTADWANSKRSIDTESNSVFMSIRPLAGINKEPRAPIWTSQPPVDVPDVTVNVPSEKAQDEPKPDEGVNVTLWVGLATALATGVAVWQRERGARVIKSLHRTITGQGAKEEA